MDGEQKKKKIPLAGQIFIALILGIIAGLALQGNVEFAVTYIKPFGTIFLNLVKFIVGPIVLFSIMAGVVSLSDIRKLGSIGGITLVYYFHYHSHCHHHRTVHRQQLQTSVPGSVRGRTFL